jgi:hypothetical protein
MLKKCIVVKTVSRVTLNCGRLPKQRNPVSPSRSRAVPRPNTFLPIRSSSSNRRSRSFFSRAPPPPPACLPTPLERLSSVHEQVVQNQMRLYDLPSKLLCRVLNVELKVPSLLASFQSISASSSPALPVFQSICLCVFRIWM